MRWSSEQGSLPLALLVTIFVTGLVSVVTASVVMGQQQTRFDESYERALQVAEQGADVVLHQVQNQEGDIAPEGQEKAETMEGGGRYEAELVEDDDGSLVVRSEGTVGDVTRTVVIGLDGDATSSAGLVGRDELELSGNQIVRSFRSGSFEGEAFEREDREDVERWLRGSGRGHGVVGTNGDLILRGGALVDGAELWDAAGGRDCEGNQCPSDDEIVRFEQEFEPDPDPDELWEEHCAEGGVSDHDGGELGKGIQCFDDVDLTEGEAEFAGSPEEPTKIVMSGTLSVSGSVRFDEHGLPEPSLGLQIYSKGDTVEFDQGQSGNQGGQAGGQSGDADLEGAACGLPGDPGSRISAVVHAPDATLPPSSAQANVYGSLLVKEVNPQGNFCVWYDELIDELDENVLSPRTWREE